MLLGCDISKWQYNPGFGKEIDFKQVWIKGIKFVIMRGCYGDVVDTCIDRFAKGTQDIFPVRGIYLYFLWSVDIRKQAELILKLWKEYNIELPPILDIEEKSKYLGRDNARLAIKDMIDIIHSTIGQYPIIYTSPGWWKSYGWDDRYFANCPLWIANWNVQYPYIPKPWSDWILWQYTNRGDGKGYGFHSKQLDMDYYKYDWIDLINLCAGRAKNPLGTMLDTVTHLRKLLY